MTTDVAYTAIVNNIGGIAVIDECVERYMLNEPTLTEFIDLQRMHAAGKGEREAALAKVRSALSRLAASTPRYKCTECGFSSQRLLWQCPSCKNWETQRPFTRVQFDSLLQRSVSVR
jgi:lipopolysaccharide biosynthesis regulator YciM